MARLVLFLLAVGIAAAALAAVADAPGTVTVEWLGYRVEASVFVAGLALAAVVLAAVLAWSVVRYIVTRPAAIRETVKRKREKRGLDALSHGLVAVGAGDKTKARRFSGQAEKLLPREPLTGLLRAQTAQLHGDREAARDIFQSMARAPETEMLGLRGLFLEARRENETEAARLFAERAMERNPDLAWSVSALFELQCRAGDWAGALRTLDVARQHKQVDRETAGRRRAVLLTAQAMEAEDSDMNAARQLALEAHKLAPGLVPAAEIAGRVMASQGDPTRAARVISKTWELSPHPNLAFTYAHLRPGDGPRDRLNRVRFLAQWSPDEKEAAVALATAAVDARAWDEAREALAPYLEDRPQARICTLMARIEGGASGDEGRVREWLARAVRAPRDPAWTADGYVSDRWLPVSPVTGALDAFEWKAPTELIAARDEPPELIAAEQADAAGAAVAPPVVEAAQTGGGDGAAQGGETEEAEVFTPPRAPDDPGPAGDAADEDDAQGDRKFPSPTG